MWFTMSETLNPNPDEERNEQSQPVEQELRERDASLHSDKGGTSFAPREEDKGADRSFLKSVKQAWDKVPQAWGQKRTNDTN